MAGGPAALALGVLLAACHALDNSTAGRSAPVAAAVRSHFNECPDSHRQFCFHGTCRFLVQEEKPACVCHSGYVGTRCEHADLLAVVAATQKKQTITALLVVAVVASALLVTVCVLVHCCRLRKRWPWPCPHVPCPGWCREPGAGPEKPGGLLKGGASCCHSETGV
ncbi:protransforming growth factor alpha [Camarhynchus parvulus]|uniref:protransforming growth factor alpha n=1 Tax=Geospiza parvula TaxID=87175 RepID=UPI0012381543|nr:protransforming growth factor alpha [Camarhynchus parvulus]